jgi:hypothetical protein
MKYRCGSCEYYLPISQKNRENKMIETEYGRCRRYPQKSDEAYYCLSDFCGEHSSVRKQLMIKLPSVKK